MNFILLCYNSIQLQTYFEKIRALQFNSLIFLLTQLAFTMRKLVTQEIAIYEIEQIDNNME